MPMHRYRVLHIPSDQLAEVSAHNFEWACSKLGWRMEECTGEDLGNRRKAPTKHYVRKDPRGKETMNDARSH